MSLQKYGVLLGQYARPPRHVQHAHPATAGSHELPSQHRSKSSPKMPSGTSSSQGHALSAYLYRCMSATPDGHRVENHSARRAAVAVKFDGTG